MISAIRKKSIYLLGILAVVLTSSGFTEGELRLSKLRSYRREFKSQSVGACSTSGVKTYEDYKCITATGSKQYQYIHNQMTVDETTGLLYDEDGFIGVAMGYLFGEIGTRYYVVLDTGIIIPVVKVDAKASVDAENGCSHSADSSVIEFVIDTDIAYEYFGGANGLVNNGNFNNYKCLRGEIADIELVLDERLVNETVIYQHQLPPEKIKSSETGDEIDPVQGGYLDY